MNKIFVDASFLVALFKKDDPNHTKAIKKLTLFKRKNNILLINFLVISETITVVGQRVGKVAARDVIELFESKVFQEVTIDEEVKTGAVKIYDSVKSKNLSFFDAVHAASMKKAGIKKVLTFDKHFKKLGLEMI